MNEKIWDHFQNNQSVASLAFAESAPRYRFLAKHSPDGHILNIGVGAGGLERLLRNKRKSIIYSLDPSEASIETLKKELQMSENARQGYSQSIPFESSIFDAVIMSEVLEHLNDGDLEETLIEVRRVLKPEGIFMGTVPANEILEVNQAVCPKCGEIFHRWGHQQSFDLLSLRNLLTAKDFREIKIETRAFPDWTRITAAGLIKSVIRYSLGRMGIAIAQPNIFFLFQKPTGTN